MLPLNPKNLEVGPLDLEPGTRRLSADPVVDFAIDCRMEQFTQDCFPSSLIPKKSQQTTKTKDKARKVYNPQT